MKVQHGARVANVALGGWLMLSGFIWEHPSVQFINACLVGLYIILIALGALWAPSLRRLNTLLSIWLFLSPFALPGTTPAAIWNSVLVAVAVFCLSLVP